MFTESRFVYHRDRPERGSAEHLEQRDERFESRQGRQSGRHERRDERQQRRHERRDTRLERRHDNRLERREDRNESEPSAQELLALRGEVEATSTERERVEAEAAVLEETRDQLPEIETPSGSEIDTTNAQESADEQPSTNTTETTTEEESATTSTPESERERILFEYEDAIDRNAGGFATGFLELIGVDITDVANKMAAEGEDPDKIGTLQVLAVGIGLFFKKLFGGGDGSPEISDIPLDQNGQRIERREMAREEWNNLTDDAEDATSVHQFDNFFAKDNLEISTTHEILIPAGTRIRGNRNDMIAVTTGNPPSNVEIPKNEDEWTASQDIILRRTYRNENDREKENKLSNGILFIGAITYRPNTQQEEPETTETADTPEEEGRRAERRRERLNEKLNEIHQENPQQTAYIEAHGRQNINFSMTYNTDTPRTINQNWFARITRAGLEAVSNTATMLFNSVEAVVNFGESLSRYIEANPTQFFDNDLSGLPDAFKKDLVETLASEITLNVFEQYISQNSENLNNLNQTTNLQISLVKNQQRSSQSPALYSVSQLNVVQ